MDVDELAEAVEKSYGRPSESLDALVDLLRSNAEKGLSDNELERVLTLLTSCHFVKSSGKTFQTILNTCIPEGKISNDIIDILLLWLLSSYHKSIVAIKINAALDWLIGLLDFNLVEKKHVDSYYNMYYGFLDFTKLQKLSCKLLYRLTRPADVNRGRVERVYRLHLKNDKKKYTSSLLGLFKMFKPELVPENVQMYPDAAFGTLSAPLAIGFELAQSRVAGPSDHLDNSCQLQWKAPLLKKNWIVPQPSYIHVRSELYREKKRTVLEFSDKESLASCELTIELPSCILSLLLNDGGIHLLATHNRDTHARFSVALFSALNAAFFLNPKSYSYASRDHLLERIVCLEVYMQQGIPVVSRFLAMYVASWNGLDHQNHIYRLLEFITFSSFEEFSFCILEHLQTLFLSGNVSDKCMIINTLKRLISNLAIASYRFHSTDIHQEHLFLGNQQEWSTDFETSIPQLISVVSDLCHQGLLVSRNNPVLLHSVLSFYEYLLDTQDEVHQSILVIPPFAFYQAVFSTHFSAFCRACDLLLRYKEFKQLQKEGKTMKNLKNANRLNDYSCDIWNCFMNEKAFKKGKQGYIFQKDADKLQELYERDSAFLLEKHLIAYAIDSELHSLQIDESIPNPFESLQDAVGAAFPSAGQCLEAIRITYSDYHS